jgi:hypothetical protein
MAVNIQAKKNDKLATKASSSNDEIVKRNLFKLFTQSTNFVRTNVQPSVETTLTKLTSISTMKIAPAIVVPFNVLKIQFPKYHDNDDLVLYMFNN